MDNMATTSSEAMAEALALSTEAIRNLELSELPLSRIALKAARIARILNDLEHVEILRFELGGYPSTSDGVESRIWKVLERVGRVTMQPDLLKKVRKPMANLEPIETLESQVQIGIAGLQAAVDPPSTSQSQSPVLPFGLKGNSLERVNRINEVQEASRTLASRRHYVYDYLLSVHYQLKFSGIVSDVFSRTREKADNAMKAVLPKGAQKFTSVYENLLSENPEDWSNAVHSCRRILQDLADAIFPATNATRTSADSHRQISLGQENYINRILCFIEDNSTSEKFQQIVGSHLSYIGNRLQSILEAAQKGSHTTISTREEADRCVVYTYLVVGDILTLIKY